MSKREWVEWLRSEAWQAAFAFAGVILYMTLDLGTERLVFTALTLASVAFAVAISILITLAIDNDPVPKGADFATRKKILIRIAKQAILMGFFWKHVFAQLEGMIKL